MRRLRVELTGVAAELAGGDGDVPQVVGQLAEQDRRIYFEYDPGFLDTGIELSPFKLPARSGLIEHIDRRFGPLPGLFDDSMTVLGEGRRPGSEHCFRLAAENGIKRAEAAGIIEQVNEGASRWAEFAEQASCSRRGTAMVGERIRRL